MSPVPRGRKTKKSRQGGHATSGQSGVASSPLGRPRSALTALTETLGGPRQRPEWFDESITAVLDGTGVLMPAQGPRELEDVAARLLGAEQHRRLRAHKSGLWFDWWFTDLAEAAAVRARDAIDGGAPDECQPYWRLLHAMTGLGSAIARAVTPFPSDMPGQRGGLVTA